MDKLLFITIISLFVCCANPLTTEDVHQMLPGSWQSIDGCKYADSYVSLDSTSDKSILIAISALDDGTFLYRKNIDIKDSAQGKQYVERGILAVQANKLTFSLYNYELRSGTTMIDQRLYIASPGDTQKAIEYSSSFTFEGQTLVINNNKYSKK